MYAIVSTGGKQYKVTQGLIFETELLHVNAGDTVNLEVLMVSNEGTVLVGKKASKCKVIASVVENGKGKKLNIFTYKAKKNIRKRKGHRQPYTKLKIESITVA